MGNLNLSYDEQARAFAGMISDLRESKVCETYVQGEATNGVAFGTVLAEGTASTDAGTPDKAINMVDANSVVAGVLVHSHNFDRREQLDENGLVLPENLITVMKKGQIYAVVEGACTKGHYAYVRHTANGGNTTIGAVADGAGTGLVACRGLTFAETKASLGDGLVLLNVDIDNASAVAGLT